MTTAPTSFRLEIATDNAAFEEWQAETARILREIADTLDRDDGRSDPAGAGGFVRDINGNKVGTWTHGRARR
jgi:hypothetical protein